MVCQHCLGGKKLPPDYRDSGARGNVQILSCPQCTACISYEALVAAIRAQPSDGGVAGEPVAWRCFHCDETFTDPTAAKEHFGYDMLAEPGCKLNAIEGGLLGIVRRQEEQLDAYHREDTAGYREFYSLGADHARALRSEEEKGYARGLADAVLPPVPGNEGVYVGSVAALAEDSQCAQSSFDYEISQYIGWLKQYVQGMTPENWRDMALRAERQLERLSEALAIPSESGRPIPHRQFLASARPTDRGPVPCAYPGCEATFKNEWACAQHRVAVHNEGTPTPSSTNSRSPATEGGGE